MNHSRRTALQRVAGLAGACMLAFLVGCASAPTPTTDMALLQRIDATLRAAAPGMPVALRISPDQVLTGGALQLEVSSPTAGFVYIFQLTTDGRTLDGVFPNAMDGANHLSAGQTLQLPRSNWRMTARGPAGVGYILAVVTETPQDLLALRAGLDAGRVELSGRYGAAMGTLREVAP